MFFVSLMVKLFKSPISLTNVLIGNTFLSNDFSYTLIGCGVSFNTGWNMIPYGY